ncbi:MAG: hypothetical protein A3I01_04130 [Betaproteobacteria bacterium RIFCSPLOWO2_02_FULL_65_24]|nr:MAG: hypothetical protein A3I01_04130 [Betaproteobacteria bacterium RIFCSPLOWO2_02_FULL_65_24]OGA71930.1 MAG: hypothetical protein A3G27_17705 [Betaproteobacteria bacterium RIFCSPLOWO2_12_FULL_66_14]
MTLRNSLREKIRLLKRETLALYIAIKDPRTPRTAKILAAIVVAYAVSPIDLIPDFIPVIGLLDDLILLPIGIALCLRLIPPEVLEEARRRAATEVAQPRGYGAAITIVILWLGTLGLLALWIHRSL